MEKLKYLISFSFLVIVLLLNQCKSPEEQPAETTQEEYNPQPYPVNINGLLPPPFPEDNRPTIAGVELGRMLFYEPMLSGNNSQACADCHRQEFAFSDTAQFSLGIQNKRGKRQAMSVVNMVYNNNEFFWDGRAHLLRDQALMPIQDPLEMDETLENVVAKLSESEMYKSQFYRAFGTAEITPLNISLALEQFMNIILSNQSKYDRFQRDTTLFTEQEKRGMELFFAEYNPFFPEESGADCAHCHGGMNFENDRYMNNGLDKEGEWNDLGRENTTQNPQDRGKFKVTSLRNIDLTPPYMHDGRFNTLEEVVEHYNSGVNPSNTLDPNIRQTVDKGLMLSASDKQALVAFLKTLTDEEMINNSSYSSPF